MFNHVAPYRYLLPNLYFSVVDIANPDLLACGIRTWISLDIVRFHEEHCQPSSGSAWPACQKNGNRAPIGGGKGRHNLHRVCHTAVTAPTRVGFVVWSRYHHSLLPSLTVPHHTLYTITHCYHHSMLPLLTATITHCYHHSLLPLLTVTITHCYHYSLLELLTVSITHCYHHSLLPLLTVIITHCYYHSLLLSLTITITHCCHYSLLP